MFKRRAVSRQHRTPVDVKMSDDVSGSILGNMKIILTMATPSCVCVCAHAAPTSCTSHLGHLYVCVISFVFT